MPKNPITNETKSPAQILGSAGGIARRNNMTSTARSQAARHARSFGVGGSRRTSEIASQASAVADKILTPSRRAGK